MFREGVIPEAYAEKLEEQDAEPAPPAPPPPAPSSSTGGWADDWDSEEEHRWDQELTSKEAGKVAAVNKVWNSREV